MLLFLADENFDGNIVRGLIRRLKEINIARVQDEGLTGTSDQHVLQWAAERHRIVLTHDVATFPMHTTQRVRQGLPMPGVFISPSTAPIGRIISDLELLAECSSPAEWEGQIVFLPL